MKSIPMTVGAMVVLLGISAAAGEREPLLVDGALQASFQDRAQVQHRYQQHDFREETKKDLMVSEAIELEVGSGASVGDKAIGRTERSRTYKKTREKSGTEVGFKFRASPDGEQEIPMNIEQELKDVEALLSQDAVAPTSGRHPGSSRPSRK
ncbi:MAG: hypothetical protein NDI61_03260 [Bdellovibrionaceae bacterium]|nr:hypothetical protein [Pseudobdellovibrionaceae bacterium]